MFRNKTMSRRTSSANKLDVMPTAYGIDLETLTNLNTVSPCLFACTFSLEANLTSTFQEKDLDELTKRGGFGGLAKQLMCEPTLGLDPALQGEGSIESRTQCFGINKLPETEPESFWAILVRASRTTRLPCLCSYFDSYLSPRSMAISKTLS